MGLQICLAIKNEKSNLVPERAQETAPPALKGERGGANRDLGAGMAAPVRSWDWRVPASASVLSVVCLAQFWGAGWTAGLGQDPEDARAAGLC